MRKEIQTQGKKQLSSSRHVAVCFEKIFGFDYYSKPPHGPRNRMFFVVFCAGSGVQVFRVDGLGSRFKVNCCVLKV